MKPTFEQIQDAFSQAARISNLAGRKKYLDEVSLNSPELRAQVESLLEAHDQAGGFMKGHAVSPTIVLAMPSIEKPGDIIGRYKILQQIGEGGCGVVYMAEQREPVHRRVALKVIKLGMDTKSVIARFEAERQALALMDHPNIATVLDGGATETGRPYFVMELVRGVKMTDYCDEAKLSIRDRLGLFMQVCSAIQHAHQKGVIHRDIKPSNILVTVNDGVPVPKVIDFGIAKATGGQQLTDKTVFTAFEQFIGTPAYMSPEQAIITSLDVDTRSDIYALGVLLYELLTGKTPFDAKELLAIGFDEMRRTIREKEPARPSTRLSTMAGDDLGTTAQRRGLEAPKLLTQLRGDLDWIVMKCLEKDRARRYETAGGLAGDIQRHLQNEPVGARPPSHLYRFQKFVRRNRLIVGGVAAIAIVLLLGVIVSSWQAVRANRAAALAESRRQDADLNRQLAAAAETRAERLAKQVSHQAAPLYVDKGVERLDQGDDYGALVWFTEALRLDEDDPAAAQVDRVRIGSVLWQCPKPRALFMHDLWTWFVQFSPDGRRLLTASSDSTARIWDITTGTPVTPPMKHGDTVFAADFSPNGQRVVTASFDHTARIWDATTGMPSTPLMQHGSNVTSAVFSPDGRRVVTASEDGTARVWDAATGLPVTPPMRHHDAVWPASFSPDGRFVLTASQDKTARVWDAATGLPVTPPLRHPAEVEWATFSPDGKLIATACADHTARIWDARTGAAVLPPLQHPEEVTYVEFSPDGKRLVTACGEFIGDQGDKLRPGEARVWDVATGKPLTPPMPHKLSVNYAGFSPDGRYVATASQDKTARVWDSQTGEPVTPPLVHGESVFRAAFSPDGRLLATASLDGGARVWEIQSSPKTAIELQETFLWGHFFFSPDGALIAGTGFGNSFRVWNAVTGAATMPVMMRETNVNDVVFSPDSRFVAAAGGNGIARVWDANTGAPISPPLLHSAAVNCIAFSPDGLRVATGSADKTARVWNVQTGAQLMPPLPHASNVLCIAFSPDGREVVTGDEDATARIWDARTGKHVTAPLPHKDGVHLVVFSPDGRRVATADWSGHAQIWDAQTGKPVTPPMKQSGRYYWAGIESMEFSRDGNFLLVADSSDNAARIWNANTGDPAAPALVHNDAVLFATFSHNGRYVVTVSDDTTARVWDAATGEPITPGLKTEAGLSHAVFSPDDQTIKTVGALKTGGFINEGSVQSWPLTPDYRPASDLLQEAQLLSLHHLDASGAYMPLDFETMTNRSWVLNQN